MPKDCYTVWENCLKLIKEETQEQDYETWFEPIVPIKLENETLVIQVPNKFAYEWLEEHYIHLLRKALDEAIGTTSQLRYALPQSEEANQNVSPYALHSQEQAKKQGNKNNSKENKFSYTKNSSSYSNTPNTYSSTKFNVNYTFDSFIEGSCNRLARSAGFAVAQRPGVSSFNPLMLYGGVGLGKTHLVQAIGNHIANDSKAKGVKVIYTPSDDFTKQFVNALKNNALEDFTDFYKQVDVLVIDDVQFFAGKERTQEIFFHIFNHLHQANKQIVMTSDRPPKDLEGLEARLLSRFKWGLTADLKQPDLETRIAIILQKLQESNSKFSDEIIDYLAHSVDSNVRELEGVMNSLLIQAGFSSGEVSMKMAKETVGQLVQATGSNKEISVDDIQAKVADYLHISVEDMKSKMRKKEIVLARQIAMYLIKEYTEFSLKSIGYHFGGRDHSTVIHAITCVEDYIKERPDVKNCIDTVKSQL